MTALDMLRATTYSACKSARVNDGMVGRIKAETAEYILERVPFSDADMLALVERMNRASGTADRSVAVSMLEVLIGAAIRAQP